MSEDANNLAIQIAGGIAQIVVTIIVLKGLEKFVLNPWVDRKMAKIEAREDYKSLQAER